MAGLPLYELKKTLEYVRYKCDSEKSHSETCTSHARTMPLTGLDGQEDLVNKRGISDNTVDEIREYNGRNSKDQETNIIANSAADLRKHVEDIIKVRNGDMSKTLKYCPIHKGTICLQHSYSSYEDLMEATTGMKNGDTVPVSSGDIYKSLSKIPYCSCNVRFASECVCVDNRKMDHCQCHQRSAPATCSCRSRFAGKYAAGWQHCSCNNRTMNRCICLNRSATIDCSCNTRCSCNGRKEFSYAKPDLSCLCNAKSIEGCSCDEHRVKECTAHYCNCYTRSSVCSINEGGYYPRYEYGYCDINVSRSGLTNRDDEYIIRKNNVDFNEVGGSNYDFNYRTCTCKSRCSCDAERIDATQKTIVQTYNKTECTCNYRGGESYSATENGAKICDCHGNKGTLANGNSACPDHVITGWQCSCFNRSSAPTCSSNYLREYSDSEGGTYSEWVCSCRSRTAVNKCSCNERTVCSCVYRTGTYKRTLDVINDVMKVSKIEDIQNP